MLSLDKDFDELIQAIKSKKRINYTGVDPVFYLIYPPKAMLAVQKKINQWKAKLKNEGFEPVLLSLADCIAEIVQSYALYDVCLESEKENPLDFAEINNSIKEILIGSKEINQRIITAASALTDDQVLLLTDVEFLHPYLHISAIEADLQGKIHSPVIILYPGTRAGQSNLKFLGIHPALGNYRSTHIGGWQ